METGKSNPIGTVGEEAIGPLVLSRPQSSSWFVLVVVPLYALGLYWEKFFEDQLLQSWGWIREIAGASFSIALSLSLFTLYWTFEKFRVPKSDLEMRIGRGTASPDSASDVVEFWRGIAPPEPNIPRPFNPAENFIGLTLGSGFSKFFPGSGADIVLALVLFGILVLVWAMFRATKPVDSPYSLLLKADLEKLIVGDQNLDWEDIQSVVVKHIRDPAGNFKAVQLTFEGPNHTQLARVKIPKELCSIPAEEALLDFVAGMLGQKVKPVERLNPNWV